MKVVEAYQAKVHLADLLTQAERGETIVVTRRGKAAARLVTVRSEHMSVGAVAKEFDNLRRSTRPIEGGLRQLVEEGRRLAFVLDVSVTVSWCLAEPDLPVGTLDLNADSTVGAAWAGDRVADGHTLWHAQENAHREKTLQQVARNQRVSGTPVQGERSNQALWQSIRGRDAALAWRMAALIVTWAVAQGIQVFVFEYLRPYRPTRGLSWSRRTNRKRSYGLRGHIRRHVRDLALRHGILVVERNPAGTSQVCPHCHRVAERFSPGGSGYPTRLRCGGGGWSGDANVAAALNLKRKWDRTFRYPTKGERQAAELRRASNGGAAVNPEQVPAAI